MANRWKKKKSGMRDIAQGARFEPSPQLSVMEGDGIVLYHVNVMAAIMKLKTFEPFQSKTFQLSQNEILLEHIYVILICE